MASNNFKNSVPQTLLVDDESSNLSLPCSPPDPTTNIKYSVFSAESIRHIAEMHNIDNISLDVASMLSEEATYRVRQIIFDAQTIMRNCRRMKLRCSDINQALRWASCQPMYGYECHPDKDLPYTYHAEAKVFAYDEQVVDLKHLVDTSKMETKLSGLSCDREQKIDAPSKVERIFSKDRCLERMPEISICWLDNEIHNQGES